MQRTRNTALEAEVTSSWPPPAPPSAPWAPARHHTDPSKGKRQSFSCLQAQPASGTLTEALPEFFSVRLLDGASSQRGVVCYHGG